MDNKKESRKVRAKKYYKAKKYLKGLNKKQLKKTFYKLKGYKRSNDNKVNKNNLELNTFNISLNAKSKVPKYAYKLLKDQPLQVYKTIDRGNHTIFAGAQGYHFENIARSSDYLNLFSFVPHNRDYMNDQMQNVQDDAFTLNDQRLRMYGLKIFVENIYLEYKLKNLTNTNALVKMYILKPRYDISHYFVRGARTDLNVIDVSELKSIESIFAEGVRDKNRIDTIQAGNPTQTGNTVGTTPYDSIYLCKAFKVLTKYTKEFKLSDGGMADISINLPVNRILNYERLGSNTQLENQNSPRDSWIKNFSYIVMFTYHGDLGVNVQGTASNLTSMPVNVAKLRNVKYDFKVCNNIKPKIQRVGQLDQYLPGTGTNRIVDDNGNIEDFATLLPINS